jgi:predicted nucleic acid-binding protein
METAPRIVIDSSVVVKWFSKEADSQKALDLLNRFQASEHTLCVSDLLFIEVTNALRYKPTLNNSLVEIISILYDLNLELYPSTKKLLQSASEMAFEADVSIYDAIPVALAEQLDTYCITADKKTQYNRLTEKNYPIKLLD